MDSTGNLTTLHSFNGVDGALHPAALIQAARRQLLRHDASGRRRAPASGTVFKMDSSGTVTTLHSFRQYRRRLPARCAHPGRRRQPLRHDRQDGGTGGYGNRLQDGRPRATSRRCTVSMAATGASLGGAPSSRRRHLLRHDLGRRRRRPRHRLQDGLHGQHHDAAHLQRQRREPILLPRSIQAPDGNFYGTTGTGRCEQALALSSRWTSPVTSPRSTVSTRPVVPSPRRPRPRR